MARIVFLVLFTAIYSFAVWNGNVAEPPAVGGVYQISSPEELAWFAEQVNGGQTELDAELTADILLGSDSSSYSGSVWPIIGIDKGSAYKGTFDGKDHVVYGLNLTRKYTNYFGLFGLLDTLGVVRNVTVANSRIDIDLQNTMGDSINVGLVVGYSNGTVYNCHARQGSIVITDPIHRYAKGYVGGVVGTVGLGSVENVSNSAKMILDLFGEYYIGGVVGRVLDKGVLKNAKNYADIRVKGDTTNTYIGGHYSISAYANTISSKNENFVGGIVGNNLGNAYLCENRGNIYMNFGVAGGIAGRGRDLYDVVNYGTIADTLGVAAGISGLNVSGWNLLNLGDVYGYFAAGILGKGPSYAAAVNKGTVRGIMVAGGIVAWGAPQTAKNEGEVTGKIAGGISGWIPRWYNFENVINVSGKVKGDSITGSLAGVAEDYIKHSYYDKDLLPDAECIGAIGEYEPSEVWCEGLPTKTMKQREFAGRLNEDVYDLEGKRKWTYIPGEYPDFKKDGYQEIFRIALDDGVFITSAYTDYMGKIDDLRIPVSMEGRYFAGWFDRDGKSVDKDYVFRDTATLFAKYSETIVDTSLVVYVQESYTPKFKVWNGDYRVIDKFVRKKGRLYYAIYTPEELNWYLDYSQNTSGILMNDIVLGKDSLTPSEHEMYRWWFKRQGLCDSCVFDGNHHTIYGPRNALFDSVGTDDGTYIIGQVKRSAALVKDLNIRSALIEQYGGTIAMFNIGHIKNCSVQGVPLDTTGAFGGLVYDNEGEIDSVEFVFDFKIGDLKNSNYSIGGIASYNDLGGEITNALSRGYIGYSAENASNASIAGIVHYNIGMVKNVRNEATFDVRGYNMELGGIVVGNAKYIINAVNTGNIYGESRGVYQRVGGIAATNDSIVDSCSSNGYIHLAYSGSPGRDSVALAGIVSLNLRGSVKNVINDGKVLLEDISIRGNYPNRFSVGGIVGANWGKVDSAENKKPVLHECPNFYNECEYSADTENSTFAIGGVMGKNFGTLKNSKNLGRVSGFTNVGGVVGLSDSVLVNVNNRGPVYGISVTYESYVYTNETEPYVGGIAGTCNQVEGAYNDAPIYYAYAFQSKNSHVGGVCGSLKGSLNQVYNIGDIYSEDNVDSSFVAGIVAEIKPGASITNAFNWGNLNSRGFSGGVWAKGDSVGVVKNVYSTATVVAKKLEGGIYAFASNYEEDHPKNDYVYYDSAAVNDAYSVTFFTPMSSDLMKTDEFRDALNTTGGTETDSKVWVRTDGYPVFAGFTMVPMSNYSEEGFSSSSVKPYSSANSSSSARSSSSVASSSSEESSSSVASSSSVDTSSSANTSSSVVSSSSEESSSSAVSSSGAKSSSSVKSSSSSKESQKSSSSRTAIPAVTKLPGFAVNVSGRLINVRYGTESAQYVLMDLQGQVVKSGTLYKGAATIGMDRSGNYILRIDGVNQLVRVR